MCFRPLCHRCGSGRPNLPQFLARPRFKHRGVAAGIVALVAAAAVAVVGQGAAVNMMAFAGGSPPVNKQVRDEGGD